MPDKPPTPPADPDVLSVQVAGDTHEPDRLMLISRPHGGEVTVREWTSKEWNSEPSERRMDAHVLYTALEKASKQRRRLSQELHRVRLWLDGGDS